MESFPKKDSPDNLEYKTAPNLVVALFVTTDDFASSSNLNLPLSGILSISFFRSLVGDTLIFIDSTMSPKLVNFTDIL